MQHSLSWSLQVEVQIAISTALKRGSWGVFSVALRTKCVWHLMKRRRFLGTLLDWEGDQRDLWDIN